MARTSEQIDADLRQRTPEIVVTDGPRREVFRPGDPAYEATIAEWVDTHLVAEQETERLDGVRELGRQVRTARARLQEIRDFPGTPTNAQRDVATKDIARIVDRLIEVLMGLDLIERDTDAARGG